jgi:hypothetical protein
MLVEKTETGLPSSRLVPLLPAAWHLLAVLLLQNRLLLAYDERPLRLPRVPLSLLSKYLILDNSAPSGNQTRFLCANKKHLEKKMCKTANID